MSSGIVPMNMDKWLTNAQAPLESRNTCTAREQAASEMIPGLVRGKRMGYCVLDTQADFVWGFLDALAGEHLWCFLR